MEKFIKVYDNLIDKELEDTIEESLSLFPYKFTESVVGERFSKEYHPAFSFVFYNKPNELDYSPYKHFLFQVLYGFCFSQKIFIEDILTSRIFLQTPLKTSPPSIPHIDSDIHHWVCLYYINDSDGDTIFYDNNKNEVKRVSPKKGRIAFFDGSIYHSSGAPSKIHRAVINYNFLGKLKK